MIVKRTPKGFLIRIDEGEELFESLELFADQHEIQSGDISGVGMVRELELGYFNTELAEYEKISYDENLEVLSLSGTITEFNSRPFYHVHGVFGKKDFSTVGGHVMRAVCGMTIELFVTDFETHVERSLDDTSGLKLLNFDRNA